MTEADLCELRSNCELATKIWGRTFSALGAITHREKGAEAVGKLWVNLLRQHQQGFYNEGLKKLGISPSEPPAVAAAKYHYLTNAIGGIPIDYVEETPQKVWIRYRAPMWTYAGVTMLALPGELRRTIFRGWHPHNGAMMGNKRLGWVSTKFIMEGDPYDEGYFIEYDRDLGPGEEMRYEVVHSTPEFDPAKAPQLDSKQWPEARLLKARRNFSREYVKETIYALLQMYGEQATLYILRMTMRCLAIQYTHEIKADLGISENHLQACVNLLTGMLCACDQDFALEKISDTKQRIILKSFKPFAIHEATDALRRECFEFQVMAVRLMNGYIALRRSSGENFGVQKEEVWEIEDMGRWLW